MMLVCGACSGGGSARDGAAGVDGADPGGGAAGFIPTLGAPPDAATPGPRDPVRCGEMGLPYASAVAYAPDGTLLAVAGPRFRLLDTSDWHEVRQLDGSAFRTEGLRQLTFVAQGTALVGVGSEGPLGVWRVGDGAFLYSLDFAKTERLPRWQQVAFSHTPLLALTDTRTVALWDLDKQAVARSIAPTRGAVGALALSDEADVLAVAEGEYQDTRDSATFATGRISLWDSQRGHLLRTIPVDGWSVLALGLSPDSTTLATVEQKSGCQSACETWVSFHRVSDGLRLGQTLAGTADRDYWPQTHLSYLPGGELVAVASFAGVWLIRASDAAVINVIPDFSGAPAFSPDGKLAIAAQSIEIRKLADGTIVDLIPASTSNQAPTFSPDGRFVASVDGNDVVLWRLTDGVASARFPGLGKDVQALAFSPDGRTLASGGRDAVVRIWSIDQNAAPLVQRQIQPVTSVVFSPDGALLATGDSKGNIYLRDGKTGTSTNIWYGQSTISALAFSPDGRRLVSGGATPGLRLWDTRTGLAIASASHGAGVVALAFSPDGSHLASAAAKADCGNPCPRDEGDPEIRMWRVTDSSLDFESVIPTIPTDSPALGTEHDNAHSAVWGLTFAPDGRTLLSAGPQNAGHIYQLPEGTMVGSFGSFFAGTSFAVAPDASRIVLGSSPIQIWCTAL